MRGGLGAIIGEGVREVGVIEDADADGAVGGEEQAKEVGDAFSIRSSRKVYMVAALAFHTGKLAQ